MPRRLQDKVTQLIERHLKEGAADLETLSNGHVAGHVISSTFEGKSYEARRKKLRSVLEKGLKPQELLKVSTLLTYTPAEWELATTDLK